jgi:hypothetical protein
MRSTQYVWLSESAADAIVRAAQARHPNETGGILIGVQAMGRPWVTHAPEVPSHDKGPAHFTVPRGSTHPLVAAFRTLDPRLGFIGDWHTHSRDLGPSPKDLAALRELAQDPAADCPHPLLVVARRVGPDGAFALGAFEWRDLSPKRIRIVAAGPIHSSGTLDAGRDGPH